MRGTDKQGRPDAKLLTGPRAVREAHTLFETYFAAERTAGKNPHVGAGVWMNEDDTQRLRALLKQAHQQLNGGR